MYLSFGIIAKVARRERKISNDDNLGMLNQKQRVETFNERITRFSF